MIRFHCLECDVLESGDEVPDCWVCGQPMPVKTVALLPVEMVPYSPRPENDVQDELFATRVRESV